MKRSSKFATWALMLALLSLILIACGPAQDQPAEATAEVEEDSTEVVEDQEPEVSVDIAEEPASSVAEVPAAEIITGELEYIEVEAGTGQMPEPGDRVFVHYTGTLEDGTVFDSSIERGVPIDFVLGRGEVIRGWDEGVALMQEGGKATLVIPPNLGYGPQGAGATIPPNATLTFEVELVSVVKPPKPAEVAEADYETAPSGVLYYDIDAGDGATVKDGDRIAVHFAAWVQGGDFLANTEDQGQPAIYTLGAEEVFLNDWDDAVIDMNVGGQRQLLISAEVGGQAVPPGEALILKLTLVEKIEPMVRTEVDEADVTTSDSGLQYYDIVVGEGDLAEAGKFVSLHYTAWLLEGESQFDSSLERNEPAEFPLGTDSVIPGWDEGVTGMRVGGRRQLIIPPELGFGDAGQGLIPANATLIFEIELLGVNEGP